MAAETRTFVSIFILHHQKIHLPFHKPKIGQHSTLNLPQSLRLAGLFPPQGENFPGSRKLPKSQINLFMMNWAIIAPASRIYKGKNLFRWEVSPGLEHHCGICATPLHNARAKTSCIGKHVEPCYRFHQQLHFVGKSHECFGCNSSDEMHHNRHKEILKIVRQISCIDQASAMLLPGKALSGTKPRRGSALTTSATTFTDTSSESVGGDISKTTRRERKKAKKAGNNTTSKDRRIVEAFPKEELDFVSEAIHLSVHESKGAWEGSYVYDHKQPEFEASVIIDDSDVDMDVDNVAGRIDSLSVKSPTDMTPRQRKTTKKFTSSTNHASYGSGSRKFSPQVSPKVDAFNGLDPKILFRLGIEVGHLLKSSKTRKELVTKLISAVKEDMEIIEREEQESKMREEGFWRWAGKTAYHAILQTRQELDWATGQKKGVPRIEYFPDDEIDSEQTDQKEVGEVIQEGIIQTKAEVEDEDDTQWQQVGKTSTMPTHKKQSKVFVKKVAVTKNNVLKKVQPASIISAHKDTSEEENAEDVVEMVRRYEQRLAGKRDLGGESPTSDKKWIGRLIISVK